MVSRRSFWFSLLVVWEEIYSMQPHLCNPNCTIAPAFPVVSHSPARFFFPCSLSAQLWMPRTWHANIFPLPPAPPSPLLFFPITEYCAISPPPPYPPPSPVIENPSWASVAHVSPSPMVRAKRGFSVPTVLKPSLPLFFPESLCPPETFP